jgi:hypothetical protein
MIPDCWLLALSFLAAGDLAPCLAVSHSLHSMASVPRLWAHLPGDGLVCSERLITRARAATTTGLYGHVTRLTLRDFQDIEAVSLLPSLRDVRLRVFVFSEYFNAHMPPAPHLERLDLPNVIASPDTLRVLAQRAPQLRWLTVCAHKECWVADGDLGVLEHLEHLEVEPASLARPRSLQNYERLRHWAPALRGLTLRFTLAYSIELSGSAAVWDDRRAFMRGLADLLPQVRYVVMIIPVSGWTTLEAEWQRESPGFREYKTTTETENGRLAEVLGLTRITAVAIKP